MKFDYSLPLEGDFALKEKNTRSRKTAIFRNVKATDLPLFKSSWSSLSYFKCSWNKFLRLEKFGESSILCLPLGSVWRGVVWRGACRVQAVAFLQPPAHALEWLETGRCKAGNYRPGDLLGNLREMCLKTGMSPRDLLQSRMLWLDDFVVISCLLVHDLRCLITSGPEKHV